MEVFKKDTDPVLYIVPRETLDVEVVYKLTLTNEMKRTSQTILSDTVVLLPNETYRITLSSFPTGKVGDKFSYNMSNNVTDEVVYLGKAIIVTENENIQDYSKQTNNKFYK